MLMASEDRPASIPHYDQTGRRLVLTEIDGCAKYAADFNPPVVNLKSEFRNPKEIRILKSERNFKPQFPMPKESLVERRDF